MTSDGLEQQRRQKSLNTFETQACSVQAQRQRLGGRVGHISDSSRLTVARFVEKTSGENVASQTRMDAAWFRRLWYGFGN